MFATIYILIIGYCIFAISCTKSKRNSHSIIGHWRIEYIEKEGLRLPLNWVIGSGPNHEQMTFSNNDVKSYFVLGNDSLTFFNKSGKFYIADKKVFITYSDSILNYAPWISRIPPQMVLCQLQSVNKGYLGIAGSLIFIANLKNINYKFSFTQTK